MRLKQFILKKIIKILTRQLKKDKDFYYSYQANIAMSFYDEYRRCKKRWKNLNDIHKISNNAAKNFLNLWLNIK